MSVNVEAPQEASEVQRRLVEQFLKLCSDPDNQATARGVDETLGELETLLQTSSPRKAST